MATVLGFSHYDPSQLLYQLHETMQERVYLRHGIVVAAGDVVIDAGANVGVAAVFFARDCAAGAVHSFEPVGPLFDLLAENVAPYPACIPHPAGLSSTCRDTTITFYPQAAAMSGLYADAAEDAMLVRKSLRNIGRTDEEIDTSVAVFDDAQVVPCKLVTLSSVLRTEGIDAVDLLKIDVERAELDVLEGIDDDDWPRVRQAVVEVHDHGGRLRTVTDLLEQRGFGVVVDQDDVFRGTELYLVYARR